MTDETSTDGRDGVADAWIVEVLLDERLGDASPPDLTARVLDVARTASSSTDPLETAGDLPAECTMTDSRSSSDPEEFLTAGRGSDRGPLAEFAGFMAENSAWWLLPFLVVFGLLGVLLLAGSTGAAPFIYTLF